MRKANCDPSPLNSNRRIASYSWGTGEMVFGPETSQSEVFKTMIFAEKIGFRAKDRRGVLETISFVHEYRHFQQDFITGVGAWDYAYRNYELYRSLSLAKQVNGFSGPFGSDVDRLHLNPHRPLLHGNERDELKVLRAAFKELRMPRELAGMFTVRRLLEMDAVIYTFFVVTSTGWSSEGVELLSSLQEYYSITKMPPEYTETAIFLARELNNYLDDGIQGTERLDFILSVIRLTNFFALAHPSPTTMEELGINQIDCLPGVRFARMAQALPKMWGEHHPQSIEFERDLIAATGVNYPSLKDCAKGWCEYFSCLGEDNYFPGYTAARQEVLKERYIENGSWNEGFPPDNFFAMNGDPLDFAMRYDLPLVCNNLDGTPSPISGGARLMVDEKNYFADRIRHANTWRLAQFFNGSSDGFSCMFADSKYCKVSRPSCRKGFKTVNEFPVDNKCSISQTLNDSERGLFF